MNTYPKSEVKHAAQTALEKLEEKDFFLDGDGAYASPLMEKYTTEIEAHLREIGYTGGRLFTIGKYQPDYGAVYMTYDTEAMDYETAHSTLISYCKQQAAHQAW